MCTSQPTIGSISHATFRVQDLLPAFLDAVKIYCPVEYEQLLALHSGFIPAYAEENAESEWWYSEDAEWKLEELAELLEGVAPTGCYFGAHEGDGSDFGFWPYDDLEG